MGKYASLADILGTQDAELTAVKQGEYDTTKLGTMPFSAVDHKEYKAAKKDCLKLVKDGTGGMVPDLDDDKLMVKLIVAAVDKDKRSDFTFANKDLLSKLGVVSADDAVSKLCAPGEIYNMAMVIQELSGFGKKAKKQQADDVKNS
jgi:hypothetical protein